MSADFKANLPRWQARLRITTGVLPLARAMRRYARIEREEPSTDAGWVTVDVRFDVEHADCVHVPGLGPLVEVVEPVVLRERVIAQVEQTVA